ncbi:hypothetical protein BGZ65_006108 [Modicella reniformis]|uniref:C2H2-type domain-containing protein n=1 Tax=Modicella reniformis TaxID=1440133 RepID=A0A9P6IJJ1_9FUNG|nr:hypothetical protein BGZ65_006108 [Modicella reniformis]
MPADNINLINPDFPLFEDGATSFTFPLFSETKLQQPQHQQQQQQQHLIHQQQLMQHQQQQAPQQQHEQHLARQLVQQAAQYQQHQLQQHNSPTNPLCTPQTPSLDVFESNNRAMDSFGFDGFSFLEESPSVHHHHGTVMSMHLNDGNIHHGSSALMAQHSPVPMDTPFIPYIPYLDTAFETPYLGERGMDATHSYSRDNSVDSDFHGGLNTNEPATPIMAAYVKEGQYGQHGNASDSSSTLSDSSSSGHSSSASHGESFFVGSLDDGDGNEYDESMDLEEDNSGEEQVQADEEDVDVDDSFEDEDDDEDEYVPLQSGNKRKPVLPVEPRNNHKVGSCSSNTNNNNNNNGCRSNTSLVSRPNKSCPEVATPYKRKNKNNKPSSSSSSSSSCSKEASANKRFMCKHPSCNRQFARLYNLHTHEKTHDPNQVRPHICAFLECGKAFSRKHDLQRHDASVHKGERNYRCDYCTRNFSRQDGLRRHLTVKGSLCTTKHEAATATATAAAQAAQTKSKWNAT